MPQVIEKNSTMTAKEPMVILPLKQWEEIEDILDEYECFVRYKKAIDDPDNQESIPFEKVKKELNLP